MYAAIGFSVLAHAVLLAIRFVPPDAFRIQPADPGLEVILVNAKHAKAPTKAEALAQANLEGGGNADAGRSKSPLPDLRRNDTGETVKAAERRIAQLMQMQKELLARARKSDFNVAPITDKDKPDPNRTGEDLIESSKAIARSVAELSERIEDQNKRPKKTFITPSTRAVGYAMYYNQMSKRIEDFGTLNFPNKNGKKLYGELVMMIPVFQDGTIYEKDGGLEIKRTSGNADLDEAAKRIVRRSSPFGRFPANMRSTDRDDLWVVVITFRFTSRDRLDVDMKGN
ncbi:energy transducer TonB [Massilia arenosa]|uniref:Energy transducer TonB n=1 Tax=Zemynaea arenosa TaxID=2561931 RepID=A0A4Y9SUD2_9BURK|nr:TonB C-terminal domain-containing protein [Massilia arenosa]TFW28366.1 energy transducer TonB [Massilia arenosa]